MILKEHVNTGAMILMILSCIIGYFKIIDRIDSTYEKVADHQADVRKLRRESLNSNLKILEGNVVRKEGRFDGVPIDQIPSPEARLYDEDIDAIRRIKDTLAEMDKFK